MANGLLGNQGPKRVAEAKIKLKLNLKCCAKDQKDFPMDPLAEFKPVKDRVIPQGFNRFG